MYILKVTDHFSAAHQLRGYGGKCERQHGHNWKVELELHLPSINATGISMDFKDAKAILSSALSSFDHTDLNNLPEFGKDNPSAENIARVTRERVIAELGRRCLSPARIIVWIWESDGSCCGYED